MAFNSRFNDNCMEFKKYVKTRLLRHIISIPFIWMMIIPCIITDIMIEIYHRICFPLYGLPYVKRSKYIRIDRHKLKYLSLVQKINCMYCGYANGLLHYASTIAGVTEYYWCGIMHQKKNGFLPPEHHKGFLPYNDKKAYKEYIQK